VTRYFLKSFSSRFTGESRERGEKNLQKRVECDVLKMESVDPMQPFTDNIQQCVALSPFATSLETNVVNRIKSGSPATLMNLRKSKRQWSDLTKKDKLARICYATLRDQEPYGAARLQRKIERVAFAMPVEMSRLKRQSFASGRRRRR